MFKNEWVWAIKFEVSWVKNTVKTCSCGSSYNNRVNGVNVANSYDIIFKCRSNIIDYISSGTDVYL